MKLVATLAFFSLSLPAMAQQQVPAKAPKPVIFNMDEDVVEASVYGPHDTPVIVHNKHVFKSLIELRRSFAKELLATADHLPAGK